jgi:hypothetical protein
MDKLEPYVALRRRLLRGFIALWLAVQIGVPLVRKFGSSDWPRYQYATFSWAMFSHVPQRYEARTFRREPGTGRPEGVPGMPGFAQGFNAGGTRSASDSYRTRSQIKEHYAALVRHIARRRADGAAYGVTLHFAAGPNEAAEVWQHVVVAPSGGGS